MGDFFDSKFIQDLKRGELPEVKIVLPTETIFNISAAAFFVGAALIIMSAIFKSVSK